MSKALVVVIVGLTLLIELLSRRVPRTPAARLEAAVTRVFVLRGVRNLVLAALAAFLGIEAGGWVSYAFWGLSLVALVRGARQTWFPTLTPR